LFPARLLCCIYASRLSTNYKRFTCNTAGRTLTRAKNIAARTRPGLRLLPALRHLSIQVRIIPTEYLQHLSQNAETGWPLLIIVVIIIITTSVRPGSEENTHEKANQIRLARTYRKNMDVQLIERAVHCACATCSSWPEGVHFVISL